MPITISYGNPALVGAASFAVGREKGRMKSGAKAADMAQGMLDRRDDKQKSNRDRNDKMRTLGAQMQQKERMQAKGIAQDQDDARMQAEAANARAQQRGNERKEDFDFRGNQDRERREWEWWKSQQKPNPDAGLPPSEFFPNAPSNAPSSPPPFGGRGGYGGGSMGGGSRTMPLPNDMNPLGGFGGGGGGYGGGYPEGGSLGAFPQGGFDPRNYTPEQLRQLGRLDSNQGKLSSPDTSHLDQGQKDAVGGQINNDRNEVINNPAGRPPPTLDNIVNDSMTGVNFGGQELPIVMGSDGTPKVMEGYKPQDHAGGFENSTGVHQDDPAKAMDDRMLKGLTPTGQGTFDSQLMNPNDAKLIANKYETAMHPDGKTPKYDVNVVDTPNGSIMSVTPTFPTTPEAEKPEYEQKPHEKRNQYVMDNYRKMPSTKPNPAYDAENDDYGYAVPETVEMTTDERLEAAGLQYDAEENFRKKNEPFAMRAAGMEGSGGAQVPTPAPAGGENPAVNSYSGEPRSATPSQPPASIALPQQPWWENTPQQDGDGSMLQAPDGAAEPPARLMARESFPNWQEAIKSNGGSYDNKEPFKVNGETFRHKDSENGVEILTEEGWRDTVDADYPADAFAQAPTQPPAQAPAQAPAPTSIPEAPPLSPAAQDAMKYDNGRMPAPAGMPKAAPRQKPTRVTNNIKKFESGKQRDIDSLTYDDLLEMEEHEMKKSEGGK